MQHKYGTSEELGIAVDITAAAHGGDHADGADEPRRPACTSTVDGAWNKRAAGFELAFEAVAARSSSTFHNPGEVASGARRRTRGGDGR